MLSNSSGQKIVNKAATNRCPVCRAVRPEIEAPCTKCDWTPKPARELAEPYYCSQSMASVLGLWVVGGYVALIGLLALIVVLPMINASLQTKGLGFDHTVAVQVIAFGLFLCIGISLQALTRSFRDYAEKNHRLLGSNLGFWRWALKHRFLFVEIAFWYFCIWRPAREKRRQEMSKQSSCTPKDSFNRSRHGWTTRFRLPTHR